MRESAKDESMTICGVFMLQRRKHRSLALSFASPGYHRSNSGRSVLGHRSDKFGQRADLLAPVVRKVTS